MRNSLFKPANKLCTKELVSNPKSLLKEKLARCEDICEHYVYCEFVRNLKKEIIQ